MLFCPNCGTPMEDDARFCVSCGTAVDPETLFENPETAGQEPAEPEAAPVQETAPEQTPAEPGPAPIPAPAPAPEYYQAPPYAGQPPYGAYQAPAAPQGPTFTGAYTAAFSVLKGKPIRLWGLSLLHGLLSFLATVIGAIPIISIPLTYLLDVGMKAIYRDGLRGKEVNSDQLFMAFNKRFLRFAGGMAWRDLWILIWCLIPIVGPIFAVIKAYAYRFVPYILLDDPEISATQALRESMRQTKGMKGQMFGADILVYAAIFVVSLVLGLLGQIPYIGVLFTLVLVIVTILICMFISLFLGLVEAYFYEECPNR